MIWLACDNKDCDNRGVPYTGEDGETAYCPVCEKQLNEIPEPQPTVDEQPSPEVPDETEVERRRATATIIGRLRDSDVWAARHVEDGISLTPERIAYRKKLRTLLDSVATSDDPASIEIPDAPPPPKT